LPVVLQAGDLSPGVSVGILSIQNTLTVAGDIAAVGANVIVLFVYARLIE
jgi:hypothetical protein